MNSGSPDRLRSPRPGEPSAFLQAAAFRGRASNAEILLGARIIHVADAPDAMMNARLHRPGRSLDGALAELRRRAGTRFCPRCVDAAIAVAESDTSVRETLIAVG